MGERREKVVGLINERQIDDSILYIYFCSLEFFKLFIEPIKKGIKLKTWADMFRITSWVTLAKSLSM